MFASAPMGLTVLCLFQAGAEMEAGARVETRAGETPTGSTVILLATPSLRLDWFAGPDRLRADVSTRILWRPVPMPHTRPLFFETFGLTYNTGPSSRSQWNFGLHGTYGEQDYTSLSEQYATQPTLPLATTTLSVNGAAGASWRSSRRSTLAFQIAALHRRSIEDQGEAGPTAGRLPTQTMISLSPELRLMVSRRLSAGISVPISGYETQRSGGSQFENGPSKVISAQPQLQLLEQLSRGTQLRLVLGFTYVDAANGTSTGGGYRLTPLAAMGLSSNLYKSRFSLVNSFVDLQTVWVVDPVLGGGVWRGSARTGIDSQIGPRWGAGLHSSLTEDLSNPSATNAGNAGTLVSADVSLRYRWTNVLVAELGGRYSDRAPRFGSSGFAWRGREVWGFLSLYTASRMVLTNSQPLRPIIGSGL